MTSPPDPALFQNPDGPVRAALRGGRKARRGANWHCQSVPLGIHATTRATRAQPRRRTASAALPGDGRERLPGAAQHGLAVRDEHALDGELQAAAGASRADRRGCPCRASARGRAGAGRTWRRASRRRRAARRPRRARAAPGARTPPRTRAASETPGCRPAARRRRGMGPSPRSRVCAAPAASASGPRRGTRRWRRLARASRRSAARGRESPATAGGSIGSISTSPSLVVTASEATSSCHSAWRALQRRSPGAISSGAPMAGAYASRGRGGSASCSRLRPCRFREEIPGAGRDVAQCDRCASRCRSRVSR